MLRKVDDTLDIYARVSRVGDDRQRSTSGQIETCTGIVDDRGATIGEVHRDEGRSAWNPRVRRKGWDRLMGRLESGLTGGVVVFDLARFSRRPIEGERLIAAAERGLLVLDSENDFDLTRANGKKSFRDQLSGAAYESDRLSTRVKRGKRIKAMRGESNASSRAFGFNLDGTLHPTEAAVVRDLAKRLIDGESQGKMIVELNAAGVTTSTGGPWSLAGLRGVLSRPRNSGLITYDGVVVATIGGEQLIDTDTHERILTMYAARRRGRPNSDTYMCSGIVLCGRCRTPLTGRPRNNLRPYADGEVRRQYWCQTRPVNGGCGGITVDQRELDRHIGVLVVKILSDKRHAAAVESTARAAVKARQALEVEIAECEMLAEELAGRLGRREIPLTRYDAAVKPLDRRLAELQRQLGELGDIATPIMPRKVIAASGAEWQRRWDDGTVDERRQLLHLALQGRALLVMPVDPTAPRRFDPSRVVVSDPTG